MYPKSRPYFGNPEVLSTTDVERSQPTLPRINGQRGDLGPNEPAGVGVSTPGADLDAFFSPDTDDQDGDER